MNAKAKAEPPAELHDLSQKLTVYGIPVVSAAKFVKESSVLCILAAFMWGAWQYVTQIHPQQLKEVSKELTESQDKTATKLVESQNKTASTLAEALLKAEDKTAKAAKELDDRRMDERKEIRAASEKTHERMGGIIENNTKAQENSAKLIEKLGDKIDMKK